MGCGHIDTQLWRQRAAHVSSTGANADTISDTGATTARERPCCSQAVFIDSESLPTGMAMPSAGQSSSPTASDGVEQVGVLTGFAARRHPVRGQPDVLDARDVGGGDVRDRFADGHAAGSGGIEQRERSSRSPMAMASPWFEK